MSGITGIWNVDLPVSRATLGRFNNSLRHRGPDGEGYYFSSCTHLGLGHNQILTINLPDEPGQLMSTPDKRYWISFDGAIYNYHELREELTFAGVDFRSQTDAEVVLSAFSHWGPECLFKFNGMWAFSIWDEQDQSLFLSRDRFGVKPLYYVYLPGRLFAFASETLAFRHLDGFFREFEKDNIARCLHDPDNFEVTGKTLFKDISQIPPGHWLKFSHDTGITLFHWWKTQEHLRVVPASYEEQVREFSSLFRSACEIRVRRDVPYAIALSGGLDSSAVYCMAHSLLCSGDWTKTIHPATVEAFIATFPGTDVDEKVYGDQVLHFFGSSGTHVHVDQNTLQQQILDGILHGEYIDFMPPVFNTVYRAMRDHSVVFSLGGHGADEQLLGYRKYPLIEFLSDRTDTCTKRELFEILSNLIPQERWNAIAPILIRSVALEYFAKVLPHRIVYHSYFLNSMRLLTDAFCRIRYPRPQSQVHQYNWLRKSFTQICEGIENEKIPDFFRDSEKSAYWDFHSSYLPTMLRNWDRISMEYGIEERNPFLDWRLVCYVFSLPLSAKIGGGFTKRILRDAMLGKMPESIRKERLKRPFRPPMAQWLNHDLSDFIRSEVNSQEFLSSEIWDGPAIRDFAIKHCEHRSWTADNSEDFWYFFSAHLLIRYAQ